MPHPFSALRALTITSASLLAGCLTVPDPPAVDPAQFETPEYHAQQGLAVVKASALYARGGTGRDVVVALIDSGLNASLEEFEGRLGDPGFDHVEDRPGTVDRIGHGTQMAGILAANKDDQGMHGIAFNARMIPFRFGDDNEPFFFDSEIARSWQSGFDKGARLFNNSWANAIPATEINEARYNQVMPDSLAVARKLVADGAVLVFPTGNELKREPLAEPGLPAALPELEKGWIAVVALKNDGSAINGKSNYCGVAAAWCIAVPGGDAGAQAGLLTVGKDGRYVQTAGTSPAAALVSGALAALQSLHPQLSPQQIREHLLATANRTGIYANSEAYGRGLMDLEAAALRMPEQMAD
ncbi:MULTISPECIES: S8 family peptidase [unclassified Pseudomonas]|uniref:S8 family peptidase n=1 Tax=unclassified Pseudomonas TaxID=196821 RepID=UPI0008810B63|nr:MULTISPECIES: S8 family peptidase [unclassified Pseudomonas]SCY76411.1 Subtilase family protein [Pseudomonas sp. NFACC37-1]SFO49873.1 Subtilase family protein [Pseudomonas sp. NFACC24-1]